MERTPGGIQRHDARICLKRYPPRVFLIKMGVFPAGRNPAGGVLPPQTKHVSQRVDGARAIENVRAFRGAQEPA